MLNRSHTIQWVLTLLVFRFHYCKADWKADAIKLLSKCRNGIGYPLKIGNHTGNWQIYPDNAVLSDWIESCPNDDAVFYHVPTIEKKRVNGEQVADMAIRLFCKIANVDVERKLSPGDLYENNGMKFEIGKIIGVGSNNAIFREAKDMETNEPCTMKMMPSGDVDNLRREYNVRVSLDLAGTNFVPKVKVGSFHSEYKGKCVFITERFGANLEQVVNACQQRLSLQSIAYLMTHMAQCLEHVHKCGYLHGNLKLSSFVVDEGTSSIKISEFFNTTNSSETGASLPRGPAQYQSRSVKAGNDPQPSDEVESLVLIFIQMLEGYLKLKEVDTNWTNAELRLNWAKLSAELIDFIEKPRPSADTCLNQPDYNGLVEVLKPWLTGFSITGLDWNKRLHMLLKDPEVHHIEMAYAATNEGTTIAFIPWKFYDKVFSKLNIPGLKMIGLGRNTVLMNTASVEVEKIFRGEISDGINVRKFHLVHIDVKINQKEKFENILYSGIIELRGNLRELMIVAEENTIGFSYAVDCYDPAIKTTIVFVIHSPLARAIEYIAEIGRPSILVDTTILLQLHEKEFDNLRLMYSKGKCTTLSKMLKEACEISEELKSPDCFAVYFDIDKTGTLFLRKFNVNIHKTCVKCINRKRVGLVPLLEQKIDLIPDLYRYAYASVESNRTSLPTLDLAGTITTFDVITSTNRPIEEVTGIICKNLNYRVDKIPQIMHHDTVHIWFGWAIALHGVVKVALYTETYFDAFLKEINARRGVQKLRFVDKNSVIEDLTPKPKSVMERLSRLCGNTKSGDTESGDTMFIFSKNPYTKEQHRTRNLAFNEFVVREAVIYMEVFQREEFQTIGFAVYGKKKNWTIGVYLSQSSD